jgi:PAS domain S-box-containing protein
MKVAHEAEMDRLRSRVADLERRLAAVNNVESIEELEIVYRTAPVGLLVLDADLRYTRINESMAAMDGLSPADHIGRTLWEVIPDLADRLAPDYRQAMASGQSVLNKEVHGYTPADPHKEHWFQMSCHPLEDGPGGISGVIGVVQDITGQKLAEQALQESERRYSTLAEALPCLIWATDANGNVSYQNSQWGLHWGLQTGHPLSEVYGLGWRDFIHPDDLERLSTALREHTVTGTEFDLEFRFRRKDGVYRWSYARAVPIRDSDGRLIQWLGGAIDIDDRKRAEEELRDREAHMRLALDAGRMGTYDWDLTTNQMHWSDAFFRLIGAHPESFPASFERYLACVHPDDRKCLEAALARGLAERRPLITQYRFSAPDGSTRWIEGRGEYSFDSKGIATRLRGLIADVTERRNTEDILRHRQKLESVGMLAGGIAHDFNNLLVAILGGASYALESLPPSHEAVPMLDIVVKASERAAHLIRELLAYSGKGRFLIQRIDLGDLVKDTCQLFRVSIPKSISLVCHCEPGVPQLDGDFCQMQQLLMNLVINAKEAIGEDQKGVITARVSFEDVDENRMRSHFRSYDMAPGRYIVLEVSDTGAGMDAETLSRIFDPFFTTKTNGHGLGLAAVQGIVRGHRGGMEVESSPGKGATFRVLLPAATSKIEDSVEFKISAPPSPGHGAVLVIDDEEFIRSVTQSALSRQGYEVLLAENGPEALRIFDSRPNDITLVLLDINMPEMSGREVLNELGRRGSRVPVLVMSGFSEMEVNRHFEGLRIAGILEKPFSTKDLARGIERIRTGSAQAGVH